MRDDVRNASPELWRANGRFGCMTICYLRDLMSAEKCKPDVPKRPKSVLMSYPGLPALRERGP